MPSIRFQLEAPLARVEAHVRATYGGDARIVSVSEVRTGGIGGFFAHRALDVVVDVPDHSGDLSTRREHGGSLPAAEGAAPRDLPGARASGLAGLLADADAGDGVGITAPPPPPGSGGTPPTRRSMRAAEAAGRAQRETAAGADQGWTNVPRADFTATDPAPPRPADRTETRTGPPTISTQSQRFAEVLGAVQAELLPPAPPEPQMIRVAPALSRLAGDLVVIAGLGSDAAAVADALADARGPYLRGTGGALAAPGARADDRRGAIGLRAAGVERGLPVLVSFGLGGGGPDLREAVDALRSLAPDQVWVVVDVSRKPDDTVRWVSAVRAAVAVDAMAVVSGVFTASASTAATLGLPEGWSDAGR